jgi:PAS domain S-box-containing protein
MKNPVKGRLLFRIVILALALVLFFCPAGLASPPKEVKRVVILYSEEKGHPAHDLTDRGIRAVFHSNKLFEVELYTEYLDESRFSGPGHAAFMADYLRHKYSGTKIDTVIAVYLNAVELLLSNKQVPFHGVPVIACAIARGFAESLEHSTARRFITAQIMGDNGIDLLDDAQRLRPGTKRVALVAGTAPVDEGIARIFREALKRYSGRLDLIDLTRLPMAETLARVGSLPPDTIVIYADIARDGAGQHFVGREALSLIARAANAPVFGLFDSWMGFGMVGGPQSSFEGAGKTAAELALRVMAGESPGDIPFAGQGTYANVYDWRELKRWKIPEKSLPVGSTVMYKQFSFWESYRWYLIAILAFCLAETFLVIVLVVNLRNRRKAQGELVKSEARYRAVADYTYDWEYWSAPDGKLLYVSPSCERITGYPPVYFLENPAHLREIVVSGDRAAWDRHDRAVHTEAVASEIQFRVNTRDGEVRWIDHICQPVIDREGDFRGVRASNRDVTSKMAAESEARQQRHELAHVTRVAAMGELTSSLAHELNQPLAAILNYANAAQRFLSVSQPDLARVQEALAGIIRDDKRASGVIQKVRGMMKKEEPRPSLLDVNSVIEDAIDLIHSDPSLKGSAVTTDLAKGLPAVIGDRVQLQQILINLIMNAAAAMDGVEPEARRLLVKSENHQEDGVKVSVRDSGTGIDGSNKERLFEPFYTTKPAGMGMGLAISQRIINSLGGEIRAENNPDGGATFYFTLSTRDEQRHGEGETR